MKTIELTDEEWMLLILCLGMATAVTFRDGMKETSDAILKLYNEKIKDAHGTDKINE